MGQTKKSVWKGDVILIAFLTIFALGFTWLAFYTYPQRNIPRLSGVWAEDVENYDRGAWVTLNAEEYEVGEAFGTSSYYQDTNAWLFQRYDYIYTNIRVTNEYGQSYWMAAKFPEELYETIVETGPIDMYGGIWPVPEDKIDDQQNSLLYTYDPIIPYMLEYDGYTPALRCIESMGCFVIAISLYALALFIAIEKGLIPAKKQINGKEYVYKVLCVILASYVLMTFTYFLGYESENLKLILFSTEKYPMAACGLLGLPVVWYLYTFVMQPNSRAKSVKVPQGQAEQGNERETRNVSM